MPSLSVFGVMNLMILMKNNNYLEVSPAYCFFSLGPNVISTTFSDVLNLSSSPWAKV
jgi:hypothetical protein